MTEEIHSIRPATFSAVPVGLGPVPSQEATFEAASTLLPIGALTAFHNLVIGHADGLRAPGVSVTALFSDDRPEFVKRWRKDHDAEAEDRSDGRVGELVAKVEKLCAEVPGLREVLAILERHGLKSPSILSYVVMISGRHKNGVLSSVCQILSRYYEAARTEDRFAAAFVVRDALHDIAVPSAINQRDKGTCSAAAFQMKLALEDPIRYATMLTTLALGKEYDLGNGEKLRPNESWKGDSNDFRSFSCKIMQNAFMQFGRGSYDSKANDGLDGMNNDGMKRLGKALFGPDLTTDWYYNPVNLVQGPSGKLWEYVEDELARGRSVVINFRGHAVIVVGIDKTVDPPRVILHSWGKQYSMTLDDFKKCLETVFSVDDPGRDNRKTPAGGRVVRGEG